MNRAQRRLAEKQERRGTAYVPKVVPLPFLFDEFTVFDFIDTFLLKLRNGSVDSAQGVPVFRDNEGELTQLCPALLGWIETWEFIHEKIGVDISMLPLQRIHNKLTYVMPISQSEIFAAIVTNEACKKAFRGQNRKLITEAAKLAQFKILMEE